MQQESFNILIDFESTGLDTQTDRPIEVGLALTDSKWNTLADHCDFVWENDYPPFSDEVKAVTGLTRDHVFINGTSLSESFQVFEDKIGDRLEKIKYVVAYNSDYDEELFKAEALRVPVGMTKVGNLLLQLPWLCAMKDIETNYKKKCWTQSHLALDYGIPVDPNELHRAINDVYLMQKILVKTGSNADDMYAFRQEPWAILQANVPTPWSDGGKGRDLARKLGYNWEKLKGVDVIISKAWVKAVKQRYLEDEIKNAPFKVTQIKGE